MRGGRVALKSKRAVGLALAARFAKCKADGGEVHFGAQLRKGLTVVAARYASRFLTRKPGSIDPRT